MKAIMNVDLNETVKKGDECPEKWAKRAVKSGLATEVPERKAAAKPAKKRAAAKKSAPKKAAAAPESDQAQS